MTNLKEFLEKENISVGGYDKFPQGDTYLDLNTTTVEKEDSPFKDSKGNLKPQYRLNTPTLINLICPAGVMADIQELANSEKHFTKFRVTRTGTTKDNTNYTVVGVEK